MALSVADRLAILDLIARYNHLMDFEDTEGWADCFTADGTFEGGPKLRASGRAELVAFMRRLVARDRPARHWANNVVIEGDGDEARTTLYLLVVNLTEDGPQPAHAGVYHDTLRRVDGAWKFHERRLGHR